MEFKTYLFDFDGTLVDSMPAFVSVMLRILDENNIKYEDDTLFVTYKKGEDNLEKMISFLKENNVKYTKIFSELPTLNDVFLELTGKQLRD